jgi:hypothetical protein
MSLIRKPFPRYLLQKKRAWGGRNYRTCLFCGYRPLIAGGQGTFLKHARSFLTHPDQRRKFYCWEIAAATKPPAQSEKLPKTESEAS